MAYNYNKVEICGVNTSTLPVLKEDEKIQLLKAMRAGDTTAREKLISGNLKLVLSVIQRFSSRGENPDDLFQIGCIGLIKAIDNFDITLDVRFSTYAVPKIIGVIRRYLRDNSTLRVSRSLKDTAYKAMQSKERLTHEKQREPPVDEIARDLGIERAEVVIALESIVEPVSLYEPVYSDGGDTLYIMVQVGSANDSGDWIYEILLKQVLEKLSNREKQIVKLRFFEGRTQTEVAQEIGISQAQVSRLEKGVLNQIKNIV